MQEQNIDVLPEKETQVNQETKNNIAEEKFTFEKLKVIIKNEIEDCKKRPIVNLLFYMTILDILVLNFAGLAAIFAFNIHILLVVIFVDCTFISLYSLYKIFKGKNFLQKYLIYTIPTAIISLLLLFVIPTSGSGLKASDFENPYNLQGKTLAAYTSYDGDIHWEIKAMGFDELYYVYFLNFMDNNKVRLVRYRTTDYYKGEFQNLEKISDEILTFQKDNINFDFYKNGDPWQRKSILKF